MKKNLSKYTIFFSIALFIVFTIKPLKSYQQNIGSPYIQRIVLDNYGFNNNNFSIIQDISGITYIGNNNGILQYDGSFWEIIKVPGIPYLDIDDNGIIYVGGYNTFGYLANSNSCKSFYCSLMDSSTTHLPRFGQVKQVISFKSEVYFCTGSILFKWTGEKAEVIESSGTELELFRVNEDLFLEKSGDGLYKLENNGFRRLSDQNFLINDNIIDILAYNQQILIKTADKKGFYIYNGNSAQRFRTQADDYIYESIYVDGCRLSNNTYAIGTRLSGIIILNQNGEIVTVIDDTSGLFDLSINKLFADSYNNLWALHNQAISRIETPSPYSYFSKKHGLRGNVNSVIRSQNTLYVATSLGVYYLNDNTGECSSCSTFEAVQGINSVCYEFHQYKERLFVSCSGGIYEISGENAFLFYNREAEEITCVLHSKRNLRYVFLGYKDGFSAIRYAGGMWIVEKKLAGLKDKITSIAEDNNGNLWLSGNQNGVYKINAFKKYTKDLEFDHYHSNNRFPEDFEWINLYSTKQGILFSTSHGVYRFNEANTEFYQDTLLGIDPQNWVYPIVEDSQGNMWYNIIGKNNAPNKTVVKREIKDSLKVIRPLPLNRIKDFFITSIHLDDSNIVWFGGFEGLIRLDLNRNLKIRDTHGLIHRVTIGSDSVVYQTPFGKYMGEENIIYQFPYSLNTISFEFSGTDYASEDQMLYQYKLEGFDPQTDGWSNWTGSRFKEYTHLFEGDYTFKMRAKNIFENISDEVAFKFTIKPPFYRKPIAFIIYIVTTLLLFFLIIKWRAYYFAHERFKLENIINERTEEVILQKEKADNLLERVLPKTTAKELKSGKKAGPYHYNMVTVLFSDIQGFTKIADQMDSELLIDELDKFFMQFDSVVEKYNIEKIKTIGDAYMCAGGIPVKNRTNPVEVVLAAMEMQNFMKELKSQARDNSAHFWDLRIGIDTGPVVAGVLGRSKISYDIWGGTVNTASRMEASGEPGKINITENTYMLIKDFFLCQYRGKMPVKYKGEIDMYFVEGFKPHLASDLKGLIPNQNFFTQLQILRINDVEEFVLSKLEEGLPDNLYYHNVKHTIDVVTQVELIGRAEGVGDSDMLILKTAALFHDMGHLVNYDTHEEESVKLAKSILKGYKYTDEQIEKVCRLITVTKMPPQPKDLLEEIMCDADLDYLGRTDYVPVSISLYKEYYERNKIDSIREWNQMQMEFIKKHQYFTKTAQQLREVNKKKQLEIIESEIRKAIEMDDE